MEYAQTRTELLLGKTAVRHLSDCRVAVFGLGGVGGHVVEGLARAGVGALDLVDYDTVDITNLNRQLVALHSTLGMYKTEVCASRVLDINPACKVTKHTMFFLPETKEQFDFSAYDYVVDAIDTVAGKVGLISAAKEAGVPVISSMGAGNKLDPTAFEVADLYATSVCPLAKVMRRECKKLGIDSLKVVYSKEEPIKPKPKEPGTRPETGSVSFVPSVVGLIIAGEVVKDLCKEEVIKAGNGDMNTPITDGFFLPGEYEPHKGCILIWPVRPGSWPHGARKAQEAFDRVIRGIARSETVYVLSGKETYLDVQAHFADMDAVEVLPVETNDAWARDVGPTFVKDCKGSGVIRGVNWEFNAWGGAYDGLYADWEADNRAAGRICELLSYDCYQATPFVMEGGALHSDGEGTLLVTEACLLSPGRNPNLNKAEIEEYLKQYTGAQKVIWLPHGIYGDETNEHVDNVCAFVRPGEVVLAWTEDESDPQYAYSMEDLQVLLGETDAKGRRITVHKLPVPKTPICLTEEEVAGYTYEPGEEERHVGERMAASYVNYYVSNGHVLVPQFGDEHDALAVQILGELYKERDMIPIAARDILLGGGNIHCITQQIPK